MLNRPIGAGAAVGKRAAEQPTAVERDDNGIRVTTFCGRDKAWPSSLWERLGNNTGEAALGYQLRHCSKWKSGVAKREHRQRVSCRSGFAVGDRAREIEGPGRLGCPIAVMNYRLASSPVN